MTTSPAATTTDHKANEAVDVSEVGVSEGRVRGLSRTRIVWGALVLSMTAVGGLLMLSDTTPRPARALPAALERVAPNKGLDAVFETRAGLENERWTGIVIHHSGDPSGSARSIGELHRSQGLRGLGYHFVIGNGRGAADGSVHAGARWDDQLPGAHALGPDADTHNRRSIGICLVGDGNQKAFTDRQLAALVALVQRLQQELGIPEEAVHLHADVAPTASPGRHFPASAFRALLRARG